MKYSINIHKRSVSDIVIDITIYSLLLVFALSILYPFVYIVSLSLSSAVDANAGGLFLYPRGITLAAYEVVLSDPILLTAFGNSVLRTALATVLTVFGCALAAYPLSRRSFPLRRQLSFLILFTMVFSGGLVPNYLLIRELGLMNSIWALVLPVMVTAFNVIIMKNFFQSIPESLVEAARIDGAGDWTILLRIFLPLSMPVLATVALWTSVAHWNAWFDAMIYINDDSKQVLQVLLRSIVVDNATELLEVGITDDRAVNFTSETIKAATTVVTILPILAVYPLAQRFLLKGIMLGGVKE